MLWLIMVLSVLMILAGRWGRRTAATLVSPMLTPDDRAKQERVYRRGALTLLIVGVLLLCFAVVGLVARPLAP